MELLVALGISQRKFSDDTGIDPTYVSRLLYPKAKAGRKNLGLANMTAIRAAYKLSAGWFDLPLGAELPAKPGDEVGAAKRAKKVEPDSAYKAERIAQVVKAMEDMEPYQLDQAAKIIETLTEHTSHKNGTVG